MPDRPTRRSGGADEPEYGWLYGSKSGAAAADQPDEPTRIMPTVSRPGARDPRAGQPSGAPPARPPAQPPAQPPTGPRGAGPRAPRPRRRRRWGRIVLTVVVLWLVFLIVVPLWAWGRVDKINAFPSGHRPADQPGSNYLLVGSDSREGLSKAENRKLGTGGVSVDGGRTDTIMILHTGSGPSMLLSIPRDSLVPIPGHGTTKVNAAFAYGGPRLLVQTIEQDTGLHIDDYVEIGLGGFVNAIDAIGGVTICPHRRINDPRANLHVKKGCQKADGATALGWARSRHAFKLGDIERAEHQRQVVNSIGAGIKSPWTFLFPWRYYAINKAVTTSLKVNKGMSLFSAANFAWAMGRVNGKSGMTCTMPISDLAVHWDRTRALQLLRYLKHDRTSDIPKSLCTKSGLPK
ncbi:LCP family protein [Nocardioides terrisoli]|uniref:LCP family protein n=1 Tax=Nocardioides terrisoli TaxID=3388267 RepID=UPI00287BB14C|nr:LCP family protein [Nocardioides marmorisolisilvae]